MIETWEQLLNGGENLKNESEGNGQEEKVNRMMITRPKQLLTKSDILFTCSNIFTNYLCSKR